MSYSQRQIREPAKFAYSPIGKTIGKETEKQVDAIKSLDSPNKLERIEVGISTKFDEWFNSC